MHELTYYRHNHNLYVAGYMEEGAITTPFDMRVRNQIDRYHLVEKVIEMVPSLGSRGTYVYSKMQENLVRHKNYIKDNGVDMPEIAEWQWKTM